MPLELHGSGVAGAARLRQQAMRDIHTDHVGSLLRPRGLLDAREAFADGTIGSAELKAAEDRAIDHVVTLQEQAGCEIITDGELRRLSFQSQILESVDGFGEWDLEAFLWGDWYGEGLEPWHRRRPADLGVVAPLRRKRHLSAEEFTYLRARTKRFAKVTLPSPSLLSSFWSPTRSREAYPTLPDFLQAVTEILRGDVEELVRLGCRYIQLDAPHYPLLIDPKVRGFYESQGWTVDEWLARGIELDNALMDSIPEVTFGFHLCRGNQASRWLVSGSYERIARRIFQGIKPGFPFCQPDQGLHTPTRLSARQISSAHVIPLPTPVRWGRARRETDWSPCFQGISQAPLHTCALSSPLRCTQAARQPPGTGSAQILRSMSPNSRRVRCPSASRSQ